MFHKMADGKLLPQYKERDSVQLFKRNKSPYSVLVSPSAWFIPASSYSSCLSQSPVVSVQLCIYPLLCPSFSETEKWHFRRKDAHYIYFLQAEFIVTVFWTLPSLKVYPGELKLKALLF